MPSRTLATLSIVAAGVLAPAATADAAKKASSKYPTVKKISPMTVSIGETMTITGSNFRKGKGKNTVVFRRSGKRAIFAKADGLSTKRLSVVVPEKLRSSLGKKSGKPVATRFQIRVLARRFGKSYTALKKSPMVVPESAARPTTPKQNAPAPTVAPAPVVVARNDPPPPPPPNCDGDGWNDSIDPDDDNDLLPDTLEATIRTNRCLVDTDGDGMEDGWEYKSALDLNRESCPAAEYPVPCEPVRPYPGKRPYPNPLDGGDTGVDHDGDWLESWREHTAWQRKGRANSAYRTLTNLWYSDGLQASQDTDPADGCRGIAVDDAPPLLMNRPEYSLDRHNRGTNGLNCLTDDERDEDGDFLTNLEETHKELSEPNWWASVYEEPMYRVEWRGTDWLDADTDGDRVVDGIDDQDFDDFWNVEEIKRGTPIVNEGNPTGVDTGLWVDPFNPCLPAIDSRSCPRFIPISGEVWRPFYRDEPPETRWPLYGKPWPASGSELWGGKPLVEQTLPPQHPLLPRPS